MTAPMIGTIRNYKTLGSNVSLSKVGGRTAYGAYPHPAAPVGATIRLIARQFYERDISQ